MTRRTERVNELLRQELSWLISRGVKDPRLTGLVTVTQVDTSADLRHARVFVSVLGRPEERDAMLRGAMAAAGYMRRELGTRLALKYVPELNFVLDESLDDAQNIYQILDRLASERGGVAKDTGQDAREDGPR